MTGSSEPMMDLVLERRFITAIGDADLHRMRVAAAECMSLHRVAWQAGFLSTDGTRMLCHFQAPDAESGRLALHGTEAEILALWPASLHDAPAAPPGPANVVVERRFDEPVSFTAIQRLEDAHAWCLQAHRVRFVRTYFAWSRRHMFCLYHAPDAESVRIAQRQAGMTVARVWPCRLVGPSDTASNAS